MKCRIKSLEIESLIKDSKEFIQDKLNKNYSVYDIALELNISESSLRKYAKKLGLILKKGQILSENMMTIEKLSKKYREELIKIRNEALMPHKFDAKLAVTLSHLIKDLSLDEGEE